MKTRILHTADWHAGKLLARQDRLGELRAVVDEMVSICQRESVDVVVVAGDLFDHKIPTPEAEAVVYQALLRLSEGRELILVAGNHDAPGRWRALRPLMTRVGMHVAADVSRPDEGGQLRLPPKGDRPGLSVAMMPWVHARSVTSGDNLLADQSAEVEYRERLANIGQALVRDMPDDYSRLLVGHMMVEAALVGGGERTATLAGMYPVSASRLPTVDYIALGHVHRPQLLANGATRETRYAGSPMQLDFGETKWTPTVFLVDLEPGLPTEVWPVELSGARRLTLVEGSFSEIMEKSQEVGDAWLKVRILGNTLSVGELRALEEAYDNLAVVSYRRPLKEVEGTPSARPEATVREQLSEFWKIKYNSPIDPGDIELFDSLLQETEDEQ